MRSDCRSYILSMIHVSTIEILGKHNETLLFIEY